MEVGGEPFGSDVEGQDVVDVDDLSVSATDSELSVASSSHQQRLDNQRQHAVPTTTASKKTGRINKSSQRTKKKASTPAKKMPTPKKKTTVMTQKKKNANSTSLTTNISSGSGDGKITQLATGDETTEMVVDSESSSCGLEASVEQVAERFAQGCECRDGDSCFANINPESAYRHRLNIAELTRSEHDMYLMGVTMASLSNPEETARRTERKRLHTQYVFQVHTSLVH